MAWRFVLFGSDALAAVAPVRADSTCAAGVAKLRFESGSSATASCLTRGQMRNSDSPAWRKRSPPSNSDLTLVGGAVVHAVRAFVELAPLPELPDWSPVAVFGAPGVRAPHPLTAPEHPDHQWTMQHD